MVKLCDERLHVFLQPKSKNYFWRTFLNKKYIGSTTKTDDLALAVSRAETAYDDLLSKRNTPDGKPAHSWEECEQGLLTSLSVDAESRPSRVKTYKVKLGILRQFFGSHPIHSIKTKMIEDYIAWRKTTYKPSRRNFHHSTVTNKTLSSDLMVLRQVLKYAKREEWIATITDFPKLTVIPRAGGWFTANEILILFPYCKTWIAQSATLEERRKRQYAVFYMKWLVFTGMRVDEALTVRFEDVAVRKAKSTPSPEMDLYVTIKGGKLSYLKGATTILALPEAIHSFERLKLITPNFQPNDFLFPVNPRDAIRQLFDGAGLLLDTNGQRRTAKSLRHTHIMNRLLTGVDVFKLAKNCRTSVKMIDQYYGSHITSSMNRVELLKIFKIDK